MTQLINKIQSLDVFAKAEIYMHYYITQLGLKYSFTTVDLSKEKLGWSKPDKTFKQIGYYYLWKDIKIDSFDKFYSEQNIKITDYGEDWEKKGFAQRHRVDYFGVYDWFWKFESQFNFE